MKMYQIYVCETCGKKSKSQEEIERCEASHVGLTIKEKHSWEALKSAARYFSSVLYNTNNEKTDQLMTKLLIDLSSLKNCMV